MTPDQLPLKDIHLPPAPSWWPPAPGWWVLAALVLLAAVLLARWAVRRIRARRRRERLLAEFDAAAALAEPAARLAAVSELLRRAARLREPGAACLQGEAWLRFLDTAHPADGLSPAMGRLLLDGPYQPRPEPAAVDALIEPARRRFLNLVTSP
ncbi:MAG: DUF4381 family protein [Gammaproteobacteria bacterium]